MHIELILLKKTSSSELIWIWMMPEFVGSWGMRFDGFFE